MTNNYPQNATQKKERLNNKSHTRARQYNGQKKNQINTKTKQMVHRTLRKKQIE